MSCSRYFRCPTSTHRCHSPSTLCLSVLSLSLSSIPISSTHAPTSHSTPLGSPASHGLFRLPTTKNEPMLTYAPNSAERHGLQAAIQRLLAAEPADIPIIVGGREIRTNVLDEQRMPSNHSHVLAKYHKADAQTVQLAIRTALAAKKQWEELSWEARAAIFLRAADLLSTKYRYDVLAAVILGQGKNTWQAEIDAAAETADFWRFGVKYMAELYAQQPVDHTVYNWNRLEYRPLEGFVYAISPFNFAAIGANLSSAPAMMGNVVVWKPSGTSILSNYLLYKVLEEAGLPPGVINFVPEDGPLLSTQLFSSPHFAGLHFTGSTATFKRLWRQIADKLDTFRSYPRIVGETGGKNFHFAHPSADKRNVLFQTIRSAFEYSGQKCSACSRLYVPRSWWQDDEQPILPHPSPVHPAQLAFKQQLIQQTQQIIDRNMGQPHDPSTLLSAVIDRASFTRLSKALEQIKKDKHVAQIIVGGEVDDSQGYFVQPTVVVTTDPHYFSLTTELFGPILTVYVYEDVDYVSTLELCDNSTPYALTGSIFASDVYALQQGTYALRHAAGNFYINDKSTGAVVGQQPFGGARGSGTNDKAGGMANLMRWVSMRTVKENLLPITDWKYPSNQPN